LPHIFDRFYRGSRANEARGSGSGLGLAIVRSVVEMHGGRVMVESRVGNGSIFTVTLPADPRQSADAVATGAVLPAPGLVAASSAAAPVSPAPGSVAAAPAVATPVSPAPTQPSTPDDSK
jgi:hypothetical protein